MKPGIDDWAEKLDEVGAEGNILQTVTRVVHSLLLTVKSVVLSPTARGATRGNYSIEYVFANCLLLEKGKLVQYQCISALVEIFSFVISHTLSYECVCRTVA